jgi:hypothetical protein
MASGPLVGHAAQQKIATARKAARKPAGAPVQATRVPALLMLGGEFNATYLEKRSLRGHPRAALLVQGAQGPRNLCELIIAAQPARDHAPRVTYQGDAIFLDMAAVLDCYLLWVAGRPTIPIPTESAKCWASCRSKSVRSARIASCARPKVEDGFAKMISRRPRSKLCMRVSNASARHGKRPAARRCIERNRVNQLQRPRPPPRALAR